MSIEIEKVESAATDLMLAISEFIGYITDDMKVSRAVIGVEVTADHIHIGETELRTAASQSRFVDLSRRLAIYVSEGIWADSMDAFMDDLTDYEVGTRLLEGKDGSSLINPEQLDLMPAASTAVLLEVRAGAQARLAIDRGSNLNVAMLAALAGVSEKTIRMAANPNNERPLKTVKDGTWTYIEADAALEWLNRRGNFKPSRYFVSEGRRPQLGSFGSLATHLRGVRAERNETIESLAKALDWSADTQEAYAQLERSRAPNELSAFQPRHLEQLMRHLAIFEPVELARETYPLIATAYGEALAKEQLT